MAWRGGSPNCQCINLITKFHSRVVKHAAKILLSVVSSPHTPVGHFGRETFWGCVLSGLGLNGEEKPGPNPWPGAPVDDDGDDEQDGHPRAGHPVVDGV